MSWGTLGYTGPVIHLRDSLHAERDAYLERSSGAPILDETRAQMEAAIDAACHIAESGAVGENVTVQVMGHANLGHTPEEGWAKDTVSVHVWGS